jgi:chromosome segregation ATPase
MSALGKPVVQVAVELSDQQASLAISRERLARNLRELADDLATSRRDCREKQHKIDSLKAENARLVAASSLSAGRVEPNFASPDASGLLHDLGARRAAHEHTLERMSSAVLVLRRANLALEQEVAGLQVELARLRVGDKSRCAVTPAEVGS